MNLGKAIRIFRAARGIDTYQLGQLIGYDHSSISAFETGNRKISMELLLQFCKALDVQPWVVMFVAQGRPDASQPLTEKAIWRVLEEMLK